jgi:hypothetical protein
MAAVSGGRRRSARQETSMAESRIVGEWMRGIVTRGQDGERNEQQADHADGLVDDVARGGANQQKGNLLRGESTE